MDVLISGILFAIFLYQMIMFARIVFSFILAFSRDWRPRGLTLLLAEGTFTVTDPPIKFLRRFIPPLQLGSVRLDLAFLVVFFGLGIIASVISSLGRA